MAYKYFSQQLLTKNLLDLSEVFPQKQEIAKEQNNVAYNLGDIVLYLQEVTENFKFTDAKAPLKYKKQKITEINLIFKKLTFIVRSIVFAHHVKLFLFCAI